MKLKQLLAATLLLCSAGAMAQTDVTSTYLTNADFSQTTALTSTYLYGYGKDGSPYGFQAIEGWTSVVTAGDNSNSSYPNSGIAGGVFSYGSSTQLKGNSKAAPATNPAGEASGNCFGFFGVWGCGGYYYQSVTLAAGKYTITVPMYNQSGTEANTTYTGFFPTSGTNRTVAVNPTVGQWVNQTVTFTLTDETAGQIRIGYQSTGSGSGANPMLFIDCVKIEFTAIVVKDVLSTALTAANSANATLNSSDLAAAISTAQGVYDSDNATQDEVNAAAATLNAATELAMSAAGDVTSMFLKNADLSSTEGWTAYVSSGYRDFGCGIIGDYNVRFSPATVDETHLATESCFGFECRWNGNYASYYQTTEPVPAGVYTLTYDVENVNGSTTNASYQDLNYVQVGETKYYSTGTEWKQAKSGWTTHVIRVTMEEAAPLTVSFGYGTGSNNIGADNTPALYVSHLKLNYQSFLAGAKAEWDEAVAAANQAKTDCPNVTGSEQTALNAELAKAEPTTVEGYNAAKEALTDATNTFIAAAPVYNVISDLNVRAEAAGMEPYEINTETTAASISADIPSFENSILVAEHADDVAAFNQVKNEYPYEIELGDWTTTGACKTEKSQHWNGDANATYNEPNSWSSSTGGNSIWIQDVFLPAGNYVLQIAGRHSDNSELIVAVKNGESELASASDFPAQGNGYGIDLQGNANFSMNGSYANTTGRGWEWRLLSFTLSEDANITISINYNATLSGQWASFTSYVIRSQFPKERIDLLNSIKAAQAVDLTVNVGAGVFQRIFEDDGTLANAISEAQGVYDDASATATVVSDAILTLNSVKNDVVTAFDNAELNAPEAGTKYNLLVATEGHAKNGNAVVIVPGKGGGNNPTGYGLNANFAVNENLNQAVTFTKVSGNNYNISFETAEGTTYLTYGTKNGSAAGWADYQIQATTEADNKGEFRIAASTTEGAFNIYNTITNSTIACQGGGNIYTEDGNADFSLALASKPSITINTTAAGWGTVILPFAVGMPNNGVKVYSVSELSGNKLTLVEVTDGLEANKPYIIEGSWNETLTGDAQGTALSYTDGLLTGTYTQIAAPNGSYILQNHDGKVGFYQVDTDQYQPNVPANRAYLTYEAPSTEQQVKSFILGDTATAISGVMDAVVAGEIYDLGGRKVSKMQKGNVYIVNGKKVIVK